MSRSNLRISGVSINPRKRIAYGLLAIYGIGRKLSFDVCKGAGVDPYTRGQDLTESDISSISSVLSSGYLIESELKRFVSNNIKTLIEIGCYRGLMHRRNLPVRGQRTRSNASTVRGKSKAKARTKKQSAMGGR